MRQILLGPFGSMGSMNMKMKNICVEDLTLETILLIIAIIRVLTSDTYYEEIGAWGAVIAASCIAGTLSLLVLDGGIQCMCCRKKPLCTSLCFGCVSGQQILSDKSLMRMLLIVTQLGIISAILTVVTESCTFFDSDEVRRHVVKMPKNEYGLNDYMEWHHAIAMIVVQVCISIPWRIYVYQVTSGVLHAIHCVEVLNFRSAYSGDALRKLLPDKGVKYGIELANESDVPALARLYSECFEDLLTHIGLPANAGPEVVEGLWRSYGTLTVRRWLGRVGIVRDEDGTIIGALSLQLPGDTAAYASLSWESSVDTYNPLDSSSVSQSSFAGEGYMHHKRRTPDGDEENQPTSVCCCPSEFSQLGLFNALRFRYKHAIVTDHVCTPGEAYVDFLCVKESAQREGVGSRLMQWAELSAEQLGCGRIALSVWGTQEKYKYFYGNLGYVQTDHRTDIVSYFIVQTIFCWKNRFYDYEKALGQTKGLAIRSAKYGFTSDLLSDSSSNGDLMASVHGLFSGVGSLTMSRGFLMRRGGTSIPSVSGDTEGSEGGDHIRSSHGLLGTHEFGDAVTGGRRANVTGIKTALTSTPSYPLTQVIAPGVGTGDVEQQTMSVGCTSKESSPALGSTCSPHTSTATTGVSNTTSSQTERITPYGTPLQRAQMPVVPFGAMNVIGTE